MGQKRILVADDEERYRNILKDVLNGMGYEVDVAGGLREAIDLADANGYTCIISDNHMPVMASYTHLYYNAGLELLMHARVVSDRHRRTQFVLYTGDDATETIRAVRELKGEYVSKFDKRPLRDILTDLLHT